MRRAEPHEVEEITAAWRARPRATGSCAADFCRIDTVHPKFYLSVSHRRSPFRRRSICLPGVSAKIAVATIHD